MTAQIIRFPSSSEPPAEPPPALRICACISEFLAMISTASDGEIEHARELLQQARFNIGHAQLPLIRSRKKIDRREKARLEVMRRAFCDASFIIAAEKEHRAI